MKDVQTSARSSNDAFSAFGMGYSPIRPATTEPLVRVEKEPAVQAPFVDVFTAESNIAQPTPHSVPNGFEAGLGPTREIPIPAESCSTPPASTSAILGPQDVQPQPDLAHSEFSVATQSEPQHVQPKPESPPSPIPSYFLVLLGILQESINKQVPRPLRGNISIKLRSQTKGRDVYKEAKVSGWKQYTALAERDGYIELGGVEGKAWITLHPNWHGKVPSLDTLTS